MTTYDQFISTVVVVFIAGIFSLVLSWMDITTIGYIVLAFSHSPNLPAIATLSSNLITFASFLPDFAAIIGLILMIESWILSYFIKSHPLGAVMGIFLLFGFTIVSFYVSNTAVQVARLPWMSPVLLHASLLLFMFINMPIILIFACIVDIGIALTAARQ
jgi:hypothetical protein